MSSWALALRMGTGGLARADHLCRRRLRNLVGLLLVALCWNAAGAPGLGSASGDLYLFTVVANLAGYLNLPALFPLGRDPPAGSFPRRPPCAFDGLRPVSRVARVLPAPC
jgi:hypothetical protein